MGNYAQYSYGSQYSSYNNTTSYLVAKALASTEGWNNHTGSYTVGNNMSINNASGFTALPVGNYNGSYSYFGSYAYYWSANESNSSNAYYRGLSYNNANVNSGNDNKSYGYSVRCLRD